MKLLCHKTFFSFYDVNAVVWERIYDVKVLLDIKRGYLLQLCIITFICWMHFAPILFSELFIVTSNAFHHDLNNSFHSLSRLWSVLDEINGYSFLIFSRFVIIITMLLCFSLPRKQTHSHNEGSENLHVSMTLKSLLYFPAWINL
jgi:uncharacterized membrane protein